KPETEEDRKFAETVRMLLQRMDPTHAGLVIDDLNAADHDSGRSRSRLTTVVFERVMLHLENHQPLELPAKVAVLEMSGEGSCTTYNCEDCGYELPGNWPHVEAIPPTSSLFCYDPCPLCGGKVGWHAFYSKHRCYRQQLPLSW